MNIIIKIEKLEKLIGTKNEKGLLEKFGLMPTVILKGTMSENEKAQTIEQRKTEYYQNIADDRNMTIKQAEKLHKEVCKKNRLNGKPFIVTIVS